MSPQLISVSPPVLRGVDELAEVEPGPGDADDLRPQAGWVVGLYDGRAASKASISST